MGTRSDRLFGPLLITSAAVTTLFTVPSDQTWLWKYSKYINENGSSSTFFLDCDAGGTARLLDRFAIGGDAVVTDDPWMVFEPSVTVRAALTGAGSIRIWGWGARLTGSA